MKIVIIGAGPTGLGAAWRLTELGHDDWVLVEDAHGVGGLASSHTDDKGFTWDKGVHVLHSHYHYFDKVMDSLEGVDGFKWQTARRSAWAWMQERFVAYPVQSNFWRLRPDDVYEILRELIGDPRLCHYQPKDFEGWIRSSFGDRLAELFMIPYNKKVWGVEPSQMNMSWVGDRVAEVDLLQVLKSVVYQKDDSTWGPNATFRYPEKGGTGAIWDAVAAKLDPKRLRLNERVTKFDFDKKEIFTEAFKRGAIESFDAVVSTMPIDVLSRMIGSAKLDAPYPKLRAQVTHVVGVGYYGELPEALQGKSWVYFPNDEPFYRMTVLSNFSPNMTPKGHYSLLCELGGDQPEGAVQKTITTLEKLGWTRGKPVSAFYKLLTRGYPVPTLDRDEILETTQEKLKSLGVWSRGRFGAWKYELSNQDHSFMQGVEAVNEILGK